MISPSLLRFMRMLMRWFVYLMPAFFIVTYMLTIHPQAAAAPVMIHVAFGLAFTFSLLSMAQMFTQAIQDDDED